MMNTQPSFIEKELNRLSVNGDKVVEFCMSTSANIEKITHIQQTMSKRLDDFSDDLARSNKRIETLEGDNIKRNERKEFMGMLVKLWPLYIAIITLSFIAGVILNDITLVKHILGK